MIVCEVVAGLGGGPWGRVGFLQVGLSPGKEEGKRLSMAGYLGVCNLNVTEEITASSEWDVSEMQKC